MPRGGEGRGSNPRGSYVWTDSFTNSARNPTTHDLLSAARWLTRPHIRLFLEAQLSRYFGRLEMAGSEALGRVAQDAKADIRLLFDGRGKMLPPHLWPDSIANSVEACEVRADGTVRVKLVSKLAARRLILEATGTLNDSTKDSVSALAKAIRGDLGLPEPGTDRGS